MLRVAQELHYGYSTCQQSANVAGRREGGKKGDRVPSYLPTSISARKLQPKTLSVSTLPPPQISTNLILTLPKPHRLICLLNQPPQIPYLSTPLTLKSFHFTINSLTLVLLAISEIHPPQSKNGFRMYEYRLSVSVSYRLYRAPDLSTRHM